MVKALDILLFAVFAASAIVQYNDPDPYFWIAAYGLATVVAGRAIVGRYDRFVIVLAALVCLAGLVMSAPGFWEYLTLHETESVLGEMTAEKPYIEETREFIGMLIALAALAWYFLRSRATPEQ